MAATTMMIVLLCASFALTYAKDSKHHRGLKHGRASQVHKLGFKPMQIHSNTTTAEKPKTIDRKRAEYIRLRMSSKHGHKIHRKNEVGSKLNVTEKRDKISRKDKISFHLATEEKFRDEKATKRVSTV